MQTLSNFLLLLLSTLTPAGSAKLMAEITSDKPRMPNESLLPVIWYNLQPNRTGVIRNPAMNKMRAAMNQVNSMFRITEPRFFGFDIGLWGN